MSKREQKLVIVPANEHHGVYIEDEISGYSVCDFYFMKGDEVVPFHDAEANAQKLVASLDMLAILTELQDTGLLKLLVEMDEAGTLQPAEDGRARGLFNRTIAAIAKATGGGE